MGNGNRRQIAESIGAGELSVFTVRKKDRNLKKETKRVTESRVRKPKKKNLRGEKVCGCEKVENWGRL